jgi:hypothetical protein
VIAVELSIIALIEAAFLLCRCEALLQLHSPSIRLCRVYTHSASFKQLFETALIDGSSFN